MSDRENRAEMYYDESPYSLIEQLLDLEDELASLPQRLAEQGRKWIGPRTMAGESQDTARFVEGFHAALNFIENYKEEE